MMSTLHFLKRIITASSKVVRIAVSYKAKLFKLQIQTSAQLIKNALKWRLLSIFQETN